MPVWLVTYMLVDVGAALTSGCALYGFPKELGWTTLSDDSPAKSYCAEGEAVTEFGQDARIEHREVCAVRFVNDSNAKPRWTSLQSLVAHMLSDAPGSSSAPTSCRGSAPRSQTCVPQLCCFASCHPLKTASMPSKRRS